MPIKKPTCPRLAKLLLPQGHRPFRREHNPLSTAHGSKANEGYVSCGVLSDCPIKRRRPSYRASSETWQNPKKGLSLPACNSRRD